MVLEAIAVVRPLAVLAGDVEQGGELRHVGERFQQALIGAGPQQRLGVHARVRRAELEARPVNGVEPLRLDAP